MRPDWLENTPTSWSSVPFGSIFTQSKRKNSRLQRDFVLSVMKDRGVIPYTEKGNVGNKVSDDLSGYKLVDKGDFVLNSMNLYMGSVGVSDYDGVTSTAYIVCKPSENVHADYYNYLIQFKGFQEYVGLLGTGIMEIREAVRWTALKSVFVPLPDLKAQRQIADFLDRETARIDLLIEKKQRLVALLGEKLDRTIRACISGEADYLNEDQRFATGIGYLPTAPKHWSVEKIGWRYQIQLGKMLDSAKQTGENLRRYLRVADVQWGKINTGDLPEMDFSPSDRKRFLLQHGDLLVNEGGSYVGRSAVWRSDEQEVYYQKALHRVRPRSIKRDSAEFLYYLMWFATKYGVFIAGGNQTTIDHLTAEAFGRYRFAFPTLDEQKQIGERLKFEEARNDELSTKITASINRLKEYRSALITAAVTGQIDVTAYAKSGTLDRRLDAIQEEMGA